MRYITDSKYIQHCDTSYNLKDFFSFDISPYAKIVEFDVNEVILVDGEISSYLYYIVEGSGKLYLTHPNGRTSLINFINAPCFLGEMELIGAQDAANSVKAITRCICYAIEIAPIKEKLLQDQKFLRHLCHFLATKAIANTSNYSKNQSYPLENRLAQYILKTSHNDIYSEKHIEASEFLGVTYRHFLYVLANFNKQGILKKCPFGYRIILREKLDKLANV